ncbi:hypothetical protein KCU73_g11934, partial [Aureobasidium melanogenum]
MDEDSLRRTLRAMKKKIVQLTEILADHEERYDDDPSASFNPRTCLSLVQELYEDIEEDANDDAETMSEMVHHISDRVIKDTVDRLADTMRSNSPSSQFARNMIDQFFEGPEGDQRRKNIEHKLKEEFGWEKLNSSGSLTYEGVFKEALMDYEYDVKKAALDHASDDIHEMIEAITFME